MSSDSDLASKLVAELRFNNYVSLAIATVVAYDYVLTFSKEMYLVWNTSWTFVTAMFAIVRYMGIFVVLTEGLYGSTFIPGPDLNKGTVLFFATDYAFIAFLAAADIVMILRVYAIYNRSKVVFGVLLVLYGTTIPLYAVSAVSYANPNTNMIMTTPHILDMSFCNPEFNTTVKLGRYKVISRLALATLLLALVAIRSCIDSFRAYKETKRWETNKYIELFVNEGVVYFPAHVLNNVEFGQSAAGTVTNGIMFAVMFMLSPRFVTSVRDVHAHDLEGSSERTSGIDAGFGFSRGRSEVGFARSFGSPEGEGEGEVEMQAVA